MEYNNKHITNKVLVGYSFYNKKYISDTDTLIYTLPIINSTYNLKFVITIIDASYTESKPSLGVYSNGEYQYNYEFPISKWEEALLTAQDIIFSNNLGAYIEGFGIPFFDNTNQFQQKPTTLVTYETTDYQTKDRE